MKMTMHIDEELLERVIQTYGYSSKTEAVDAALREMDRRARFRAVVAEGMGFAPEELEAAVDPDYDVMHWRVAEPAAKYGKKDGRKRRR